MKENKQNTRDEIEVENAQDGLYIIKGKIKKFYKNRSTFTINTNGKRGALSLSSLPPRESEVKPLEQQTLSRNDREKLRQQRKYIGTRDAKGLERVQRRCIKKLEERCNVFLRKAVLNFDRKNEEEYKKYFKDYKEAKCFSCLIGAGGASFK